MVKPLINEIPSSYYHSINWNAYHYPIPKAIVEEWEKVK